MGSVSSGPCAMPSMQAGPAMMECGQGYHQRTSVHMSGRNTMHAVQNYAKVLVKNASQKSRVRTTWKLLSIR